jgi:hypothetical protein
VFTQAVDWAEVLTHRKGVRLRKASCLTSGTQSSRPRSTMSPSQIGPANSPSIENWQPEQSAAGEPYSKSPAAPAASPRAWHKTGSPLSDWTHLHRCSKWRDRRAKEWTTSAGSGPTCGRSIWARPSPSSQYLAILSQHPNTTQDQVACLGCIKRHLRPGGPARGPRGSPGPCLAAGLLGEKGGRFEMAGQFRPPKTGRQVRNFRAWSYEPASQTATSRTRHGK